MDPLNPHDLPIARPQPIFIKKSATVFSGRENLHIRPVHPPRALKYTFFIRTHCPGTKVQVTGGDNTFIYYLISWNTVGAQGVHYI